MATSNTWRINVELVYGTDPVITAWNEDIYDVGGGEMFKKMTTSVTISSKDVDGKTYNNLTLAQIVDALKLVVTPNE